MINTDGNHHEELPFCALPTERAPLFTAEAYDPVDDSLKTVRLEDYRGKWVVLLFYASDFTFV
ncbi:peroxiredoxin (alkyl hydroperoxide reductase subunit C) [Alteribacillus iranensis]|uniref:Peroxiredoxin (Alkyl hydroperoxide reductase subunit C) n=1 Tax=Alteribacillus iranensis TaxID=930128 RepID=A0A1I2EYG6_9BACI|nr:peroxiredoxin (alkyl hydroperoxide reductase subunit C) [Alteribacillus iranensis]